MIGSNTTHPNGDAEEIVTTGGKWEDEEERRFFEDIQDLKDFVPSSVLGVEEDIEEDSKEIEQERVEREKEEVRKLEEELERLGDTENQTETDRTKFDESPEDECVFSIPDSSLLKHISVYPHLPLARQKQTLRLCPRN